MCGVISAPWFCEPNLTRLKSIFWLPPRRVMCRGFPRPRHVPALQELRTRAVAGVRTPVVPGASLLHTHKWEFMWTRDVAILLDLLALPASTLGISPAAFASRTSGQSVGRGIALSKGFQTSSVLGGAGISIRDPRRREHVFFGNFFPS